MQSCSKLESLTLYDTAAVDADFALLTRWVQPLREIEVEWEDPHTAPDLILQILSNFTATLTDLTVELAGSFASTTLPVFFPASATASCISPLLPSTSPTGSDSPKRPFARCKFRTRSFMRRNEVFSSRSCEG